MNKAEQPCEQGEQPCEQPSKKLGNPHKYWISETEQGEQPEQPYSIRNSNIDFLIRIKKSLFYFSISK